jgi:acetylornithine deacetylase
MDVDCAALRDCLERLSPYHVNLLADLVRLDSCLGQDKLVQTRVLSELQRLGLDVEVIDSRGDHQSMNLAARIPGQDSSCYRSLVLNAHADTAAVEAPQSWSHAPFAADIKDGRLYGRGSQDDKAGIVTILLALAAMQDIGLKFGGDLVIHCVTEEETTGNGTKAVLARGYGGDGVIICDGTWPERAIYAHLGQASFRVTISADAIAACNVRRTSHPFDRAAELVTALKERLAALHSGCGSFEGIDPPFFVNVGALHGGVWCGSVPASLTMDIQIGFAPPLDVAQVEAQVAALARTIPGMAADPWLLKREPFRADPANRLIAELVEVVRRGRGKDLMVQAVTGHTDMPYFSTPDICLHGPGGGAGAHGIDEYYILDHMAEVAQDLVMLSASWCWQNKS